MQDWTRKVFFCSLPATRVEGTCPERLDDATIRTVYTILRLQRARLVCTRDRLAWCMAESWFRQPTGRVFGEVTGDAGWAAGAEKRHGLLWALHQPVRQRSLPHWAFWNARVASRPVADGGVACYAVL
jgi:hypothetical protein